MTGDKELAALAQQAISTVLVLGDALERVYALHRAVPLFEHEDVCIESDQWSKWTQAEQDEHRDERHAMSDWGEHYCIDFPTGEHHCEECRSDHGDTVDHPCATIEALEAKG